MFAASMGVEWPDSAPDYYWPDNSPDVVETFIAFYAERGYVRCENDSIEEGVEKVALYLVGGDQFPESAGRSQAIVGWIVVKLGEDGEDISHELRAVEPVTRRFISLGNYQAGPLASRPVLSAHQVGATRGCVGNQMYLKVGNQNKIVLNGSL